MGACWAGCKLGDDNWWHHFFNAEGAWPTNVIIGATLLMMLGNQDLLKKGEIRRENGSVYLFSKKTKGKRITILRVDEVLSNNSNEEVGEEIDVDREPKSKVHEKVEFLEIERVEVPAERVEDFQVHEEGKLQADDEYFDKTI
ncbi:hypothetical protein LguiA_026402 [Lonicera macranthoides]